MARKRGPGRRRRGTDAMFAKERKRLREMLVERDGPDCFYCHEETTEYDRSVEHLEALMDGGPDVADNFRLAHQFCNSKVGSLSVKDKVWVRESLRGKGRAGWGEIEGEVKRRQRVAGAGASIAKPGRGQRRARGSGQKKSVKACGVVTPREEAAAERALRAWGLDP